MTDEDLLRRFDQHVAIGTDHLAHSVELLARGNVLHEMSNELIGENRTVLAGVQHALQGVGVELRHMSERGERVGHEVVAALQDLGAENRAQQEVLRELGAEGRAQQEVLRELGAEGRAQQEVLRELGAEGRAQQEVLRELGAEGRAQQEVLRELGAESRAQQEVLRELGAESRAQQEVLRDLRAESRAQQQALFVVIDRLTGNGPAAADA